MQNFTNVFNSKLFIILKSPDFYTVYMPKFIITEPKDKKYSREYPEAHMGNPICCLLSTFNFIMTL